VIDDGIGKNSAPRTKRPVVQYDGLKCGYHVTHVVSVASSSVICCALDHSTDSLLHCRVHCNCHRYSLPQYSVKQPVLRVKTAAASAMIAK
jgi:hypothetical protein